MPSPRYAITVREEVPLGEGRSLIVPRTVDLTELGEAVERILAGKADAAIIEGTCRPATEAYLASLRGPTIKVEGEWRTLDALALAAPSEE